MSKLYVTPLDGLVTVIVPVAIEHVGWVTKVVGTEGVAGCGLIVVAATDDTQPDTSSLVTTWYVAAIKAFEVADAW